jgi:hypothetical protein
LRLLGFFFVRREPPVTEGNFPAKQGLVLSFARSFARSAPENIYQQGNRFRLWIESS